MRGPGTNCPSHLDYTHPRRIRTIWNFYVWLSYASLLSLKFVPSLFLGLGSLWSQLFPWLHSNHMNFFIIFWWTGTFSWDWDNLRGRFCLLFSWWVLLLLTTHMDSLLTAANWTLQACTFLQMFKVEQLNFAKALLSALLRRHEYDYFDAHLLLYILGAVLWFKMISVLCSLSFMILLPSPVVYILCAIFWFKMISVLCCFSHLLFFFSHSFWWCMKPCYCRAVLFFGSLKLLLCQAQNTEWIWNNNCIIGGIEMHFL